jgi:hypothetical protein
MLMRGLSLAGGGSTYIWVEIIRAALLESLLFIYDADIRNTESGYRGCIIEKKGGASMNFDLKNA